MKYFFIFLLSTAFCSHLGAQEKNLIKPVWPIWNINDPTKLYVRDEYRLEQRPWFIQFDHCDLNASGDSMKISGRACDGFILIDSTDKHDTSGICTYIAIGKLINDSLINMREITQVCKPDDKGRFKLNIAIEEKAVIVFYKGSDNRMPHLFKISIPPSMPPVTSKYK